MTSSNDDNNEEKFNKMELKNWVQGYKEYDEGERIKEKPYFIFVRYQAEPLTANFLINYVSL